MRRPNAALRLSNTAADRATAEIASRRDDAYDRQLRTAFQTSRARSLNTADDTTDSTAAAPHHCAHAADTSRRVQW